MDLPAPPQQLEAILEDQGLRHGLEFLNARVPYRFTALYKLEQQMLRKICLVDKRGGDGLPFMDHIPLEKSLAKFAIPEGEFITADTIEDKRLVPHRHAGMVGSCICLRLMTPSNEVWGVFSHFDMINRIVPQQELAMLRQVPALLSRFL